MVLLSSALLDSVWWFLNVIRVSLMEQQCPVCVTELCLDPVRESSVVVLGFRAFVSFLRHGFMWITSAYPAAATAVGSLFFLPG